MIPQRNFVFADSVSAAYISNEYVNVTGDTLDLQVSGDFSECSLTCEGKTDINADYVALKLVDLGEFKAVKEVTAPGIYELGIGGLQSIRINIASVDGGAITVMGRITKEG